MERYKPLVRAQAASYYLPGADAEDLVQEGMIGLFRAIQDFDPAKGAFGSFAKLCVQRQVISAVKASTRQKHQLLNEFVSFDARTDGQHALRDVLPGPQEEEPEALILQKQPLTHTEPYDAGTSSPGCFNLRYFEKIYTFTIRIIGGLDIFKFPLIYYDKDGEVYTQIIYLEISGP